MNTPIPDERHRELRERLGAHVLDQLDADERAEVDAHLAGCPECRAEVDDLLPLVGPLSAVDPDRLEIDADAAAGADAAGAGPTAGDPGPGFAAVLARIRAEQDGGRAAPPDTGPPVVRAPLDPPTIETAPVPHLHTAAATPRTGAPDGNGVVRPLRRRPRTATLRAAAAAAVIALAGVGIGTALAPGSSDGPLESVGVQALRPGIDAEAGVVPHTWGVELKLTATGFDPGRTYRAAVLDTAGRTVGAGEFVGTGGEEMECNLNSSVLRDRATGFVVTDEAGSPVLVSRFEA